MHRAPDRGAEIDGGNRAGRAGGETIGIERGDESRQAETFGDAAGDQSEQPLMPAFSGKEEQRQARIGGKRRIGCGESFFQHPLLDGLPLGVERFEPGCYGARLDRVIGRKKSRAEARGAHPAAGIDTGAEDEAERIAGRRRVDARGIGERNEALVVPEAQDLEPLRHESAVRLPERHHIADRGQRHKIEQAEQIGLRQIAVKAVAAKRARRRHQEQKHDARGGEMSLAREIVLPVRVDDGKSGRQRLVGLMMIDDDHFGAGGVGGGDGGLRVRSAIDGEDETRPSFGKRRQGPRARVHNLQSAGREYRSRHFARGRAGSARSARPKPHHRHRNRRIRRSSPARRWRRQSARPPSPCPSGAPDRGAACGAMDRDSGTRCGSRRRARQARGRAARAGHWPGKWRRRS